MATRTVAAVSPLAFPPGDPPRMVALLYGATTALADMLLDWRALGWPLMTARAACQALAAGSWALRLGDPDVVTLDTPERLVVADVAAIVRRAADATEVWWRLEARVARQGAPRWAWIGLDGPGVPRVGVADWMDVLLTVPPKAGRP